MKKLNKRGFTLVELLAVIVILALLMVVATTAIIPSLGNTKKKLMVVYAEKVLKEVQEDYEADAIIDGYTTKYYSVEELMGDNNYYGVVKVKPEDTSYKFDIALFNSDDKTGLKLMNLKNISIEEKPENIVKSGDFEADKTKYDTHTKVANNNDTNIFKRNLIDFSLVKKGGVSPSDGRTRSNNSFRYSDYISIIPGNCYKFNSVFVPSNSVGIAYYNENKEYISGIGLKTFIEDNIEVLQVPSEGHFIRLTWNITYRYNPDYESTVKFFELDNCPS